MKKKLKSGEEVARLDDGYGAVVFYHGNCPDGATAAWVASEALSKIGHKVKSVPVQHDEMRPDGQLVSMCKGRVVFMVDVCQEVPTLRAIERVASHFMVLDHHATAEPRAKEVACCHVDSTRCGAMLAWEHFFGGEPPKIVKYVNDFDLWKNLLKDTEPIRCVLKRDARDPAGAERLHNRMESDISAVIRDGKKILASNKKVINGALERSVTAYLGGVRVQAIHAFSMKGEIGNALSEKTGEIACVWSGHAGGFSYSLRSTGQNVAEIAKSFGGGGHICAAGFKTKELVLMSEPEGLVPIEEPRKKVDRWSPSSWDTSAEPGLPTQMPLFGSSRRFWRKG